LIPRRQESVVNQAAKMSAQLRRSRVEPAQSGMRQNRVNENAMARPIKLFRYCRQQSTGATVSD